MKLTDEEAQAVAAAEAKHTADLVVSIKTIAGLFVFRSPTRESFRRFKSMSADKHQEPDAAETLVLDCLLHPNAEEADRRFNRYPGIIEPLGLFLCHAAGAGTSMEKKE